MRFLLNDSAPTAIYTLSLHDALPISGDRVDSQGTIYVESIRGVPGGVDLWRWDASIDGSPNANGDRKSTRLNSSHLGISYAVFCLKKKKKKVVVVGDVNSTIAWALTA